VREPTADHGLVVVLQAHMNAFRLLPWRPSVGP
jgi:hypothetical protein